MGKQKIKIAKFIHELSSKNYARAHKYLKSVVEDKLAKKSDPATEKPLF